MMHSTATESELRELLCEIGRRVWQKEWVAANDGNFSVKLSPTEILCTPTMVSKGFMKPFELAVITPDNKQIRGPLPATSEIRLHLEIYKKRPEVQAVIHAHPAHATAFAVAQQPIPKCMMPEVEVFLGEIPIAPYETPGTWDFAETLDPFLPYYNAFLLASHGAVTCGSNPLEAYYRMETLDHYCRVLLLAMQAGGWSQITPEKVKDLWKIREKIGGGPDRRSSLPVNQICEMGVPGEKLDNGSPSRDTVQQIVDQVMKRLQQ